MLMYQIAMKNLKEKQCCPSCAKKKFIDKNCPVCGGNGSRSITIKRYEVLKEPITIGKIDRCPKNGKLRYWISASEYFYEETYLRNNTFCPDIPHGVHHLHYSLIEAQTECERINKYLEGE